MSQRRLTSLLPQKKNSSALIVFAKLPRAGKVKTRLGESIGMEKAVEVYQRFAEHAFTLADDIHSEGVDVYVFYAPGAGEEEIKKWVGRDFVFIEQHGATLGERMKNAFDRTFADGATHTVIIGTDVPELDSTTLRSSFEFLSTLDVVLGPSTDGGYYLLGMNAPIKNLFDEITWSTSSVFEATLRRISTINLSSKLLHSLSDIDTEEEYREYLRRTSAV
jgi:rSAM/selenodomain-associated transferase 1